MAATCKNNKEHICKNTAGIKHSHFSFKPVRPTAITRLQRVKALPTYTANNVENKCAACAKPSPTLLKFGKFGRVQ